MTFKDPDVSFALTILSTNQYINIQSMPGRLENKVAIITGAGSGIGLEAAILFASEGANVVCADINGQAADKTAKLIAETVKDGPRALAVVADVGKESDIEKLVEKAVAEYGRLDVMFNNAGISRSGGLGN